MRSLVRNAAFFDLAPVPGIARELRQRLPVSYVAFLERYGAARLFRRGGHYLVGVRTPDEAGGDWLRCGHYQSDIAAFRTDDLQPGSDAPVYELDGRRAKPTRLGFEEWLHHRCTSARKTFSTPQWTTAVAAAVPFSTHEQQLILARTRYQWQHVGFERDGDAVFQVHNGSDQRLPFLSIGARSADNRIAGNVWLNVGDIAPGETRQVRHHAYRDQIPRDAIVFHDLPEPTPERRDGYWELRAEAAKP